MTVDPRPQPVSLGGLQFLGAAPLSEHAHLRQLLRGRRVRGRRRIAGPPATVSEWERETALQADVQRWLR